MSRNFNKIREEARRLFLAGEMSSNASMAARLGVKPHTVGRWRRLEDWDGLRRKIDRRAAELFVEKIATDRVTLNVRHFRYWDAVLGNLAEELKKVQGLGIRELERVAGTFHRAAAAGEFEFRHLQRLPPFSGVSFQGRFGILRVGSIVPGGTRRECSGGTSPRIEILGYFQASLRD